MTPHDRALLVLADLELAHDRGETVDGSLVAKVIQDHAATTKKDQVAVMEEVKRLLLVHRQAGVELEEQDEQDLLPWALIGLVLGPVLAFGIVWVVDLVRRML